MMSIRRVALPGAFVLTLAASGALAQDVTYPPLDGAAMRANLAATMNPPGRAMPKDVEALDGMVARKDYGALTKRLAGANLPDDIALDMNWEQVQLYKGAGFAIAYGYMYDLWRLGSALPAPAGNDMKQTASMFFLYSLDLVLLDGVKCADASAPGHRADQLFFQNKGLIQYMSRLPQQTRMALGTLSLGIESATSGLRQNDEVLCSGGMAQIQQGLAAQAGTPASPAQPQFLDTDAWTPKQTSARQSLPSELTKLLTDMGAAAPPAAAK